MQGCRAANWENQPTRALPQNRMDFLPIIPENITPSHSGYLSQLSVATSRVIQLVKRLFLVGRCQPNTYRSPFNEGLEFRAAVCFLKLLPLKRCCVLILTLEKCYDKNITAVDRKNAGIPTINQSLSIL
ncbi:unnamed protein product [Phytomonas sp. EM1]|nr:unnamed protein product [Phytomonas sp. EM1]|eukprot:CCW60351.1 unnamed protein product [Phytomonas sp. isolate EM1]